MDAVFIPHEWADEAAVRLFVSEFEDGTLATVFVITDPVPNVFETSKETFAANAVIFGDLPSQIRSHDRVVHHPIGMKFAAFLPFTEDVIDKQGRGLVAGQPFIRSFTRKIGDSAAVAIRIGHDDEIGMDLLGLFKRFDERFGHFWVWGEGLGEIRVMGALFQHRIDFITAFLEDSHARRKRHLPRGLPRRH